MWPTPVKRGESETFVIGHVLNGTDTVSKICFSYVSNRKIIMGNGLHRHDLGSETRTYAVEYYHMTALHCILRSSFLLRPLSSSTSSTSYPLCLFAPYSAQLANHSSKQPPIHLHLLLFIPIIIFPFHVSLLLSTQRGIHLCPVSPAFSHPYNIKHEIFYSSHVLPFNTASTLHNIPIRKPVLFPISCRHYVTGYTEIYTG